jgi:signal transduction histidine kinase
MSEPTDREPEVIHRLRNLLSIVVSFSDLLLLDLPEDDRRRTDVGEIDKAARAALALIPELTNRIR